MGALEMMWACEDTERAARVRALDAIPWRRYDHNSAQPLRWRGKSYANIGWALPDVLAQHPRATDAQVADLLDVDQQAVSRHRTRVGIPPASQRCPVNPYARKEES